MAKRLSSRTVRDELRGLDFALTRIVAEGRTRIISGDGPIIPAGWAIAAPASAIPSNDAETRAVRTDIMKASASDRMEANCGLCAFPCMEQRLAGSTDLDPRGEMMGNDGGGVKAQSLATNPLVHVEIRTAVALDDDRPFVGYRDIPADDLAIRESLMRAHRQRLGFPPQRQCETLDLSVGIGMLR